MFDALAATDKSRLRTLLAEALKEADGGIAHFHIYIDYADAVIAALGAFTPGADSDTDGTLRSIA